MYNSTGVTRPIYLADVGDKDPLVNSHILRTGRDRHFTCISSPFPAKCTFPPHTNSLHSQHTDGRKE